MTQYKIFLAGAKALDPMREICRTITTQLNYQCSDLKIVTVDYMDFPAQLKAEGTQQEDYDQHIANESNIVIFLLDSRLGDITKQEFDLAWNALQNKKFPHIYVFSRLGDGNSNADINAIREKISKDKQYYIEYADNENFRYLLYHQLNMFLLKKPADDLGALLYTESDSFTYKNLIEDNKQTYRTDDTGLYLERNIDKEKASRNIICFSGAPMSGKSKAMVHFANRLFARLSEEDKGKRHKTQLLVITPRVSKNRLTSAIEYLQKLEEQDESGSRVNTIVLIDDFDSKLSKYQDEKNNFVCACIRLTLRHSGNYLLFTQKERKGGLDCQDTGRPDYIPVEDRVIAPLTDAEWREYRLELKAAGYDDVDIVNRHVIGALFDKHSKEQLIDKLKTIGAKNASNGKDIDVLQVANEIYELSLLKTNNSIKVADLAYLHWHHEWKSNTHGFNIGKERFEAIMQDCREAVNVLASNGFLLGIDEKRIYIDEYLVSNIFASMAIDEALQDLKKFIHFRFSKKFLHGERLYHQENSVPRITNKYKWKHRLLVSVELLDSKKKNELEAFARKLTSPTKEDCLPEVFYVAQTKKELDNDDKKMFDKLKALVWAYRLTADNIRYSATLDEAMEKRQNLKKWVDENLVDKGAFWTIDAALMAMDGFTQADFDKMKEDFLVSTNEGVRLVEDYGEFSTRLISLIARFLDFDSLLMLGNSMLESCMLSQDCITIDKSDNYDDDDDYDYDDDDDDYSGEKSDYATSITETESGIRIGDMKKFNANVEIMRNVLFNSVLQKANTYEEVMQAWKYGERLYGTEISSRIQHVRLYTWKTLSANLKPSEMKRIALWLMDIDCGDNEILLYIRLLGINVCLDSLSENDVLDLSQKLHNNIDNYTCTSVMKHLTFECAMSFFINRFLPAIKQRDERNPNKPKYMISIEVFNVLMEKTATKSDYLSVLGFMNKAGYSISHDEYALGIALNRDFLHPSEKVQLIKDFKARRQSLGNTKVKLNIKTISGLIKSSSNSKNKKQHQDAPEYKFADLFEIFFANDSERKFGLNSEEQACLYESVYLVSLLIENAESREDYDAVMSRLGKKAEQLICHPDGNIVSITLKNRAVLKEYDDCIAYIEELKSLYPEYRINGYAVNTLLSFLRNCYRELKSEEKKKQKDDFIGKANKFIQESIKNDGFSLQSIFYSRVGICESCDEIQDFVNDNGDIIQSTPYEQFVKNIFQSKTFWKNIPGFTIHEVLDYRKKVENRADKVQEILCLSEEHGIQFSYEDISKIDDAIYKAGLWNQNITDRLHRLCHYKDFLKSMIAFLTRKENRWSWMKTENEIDDYNNNIAVNGHEVIRTVTYWNAVLKNISINKKRTVSDLNKAKIVFDELRNNQLATNETYASYCKMIPSPRTICKYIDEINDDNQDCILHLVSNAIIKCKDFDEVLDILEDYNHKVAEFTTYLINGVLEKYLQDDPDYIDELIDNLIDPDISLCEIFINTCNDDGLPEEELSIKARNCRPNSSTFAILISRLRNAEQFDRITDAMYKRSIRIDDSFVERLIRSKDNIQIWKPGIEKAFSRKMVSIKDKNLYKDIRKIMKD